MDNKFEVGDYVIVTLKEKEVSGIKFYATIISKSRGKITVEDWEFKTWDVDEDQLKTLDNRNSLTKLFDKLAEDQAYDDRDMTKVWLGTEHGNSDKILIFSGWRISLYPDGTWGIKKTS